MEKLAKFVKMQSSFEAQKFAKFLDATPLEEIPGMHVVNQNMLVTVSGRIHN